ncbi:MAG: CHASE2 domain-containing protein [Candidatus Omnitrophica bacterium]|nr:CHASE2 domain-containing protein [Candidatus Omnitrophota bacterium]MCB9784667.1 CHASE2 domain-containing protein [Candidatus Omnitrophota bacterium]
MTLKDLGARLLEGGPIFVGSLVGILFGLWVYFGDYSSIEATTVNIRFKLRNELQPWHKKPENIVFIDINDAALLANTGGDYETPRRWPWPRSNWSSIHQFLKQADIHPAAVVYDIVFDLADDAPAEAAKGYTFVDQATETEQITNDQAFQAAVEAMPEVPVFMAALLTPQSKERFTRPDYQKAYMEEGDLRWAPPPGRFRSFGMPFEASIHDPVYYAKTVAHPWDTEWWCEVSSLEFIDYSFRGLDSSLLNACTGSGMTTIDPEEDGIIRAAPLFIEFDGILYPSLPLQVVLNLYGATAGDIGFEGGHITIPKQDGGVVSVPVDDRKRLRLNFRFDWKDEENGYLRLNYWKLINGLNWIVNPAMMEEQGKEKVVLPDLNDKILIVGSSAAATYDIKATPIDNAFPGMGTIGTIIRSIQQEDFLVSVPVWLNALLVFGACFLVGVFGIYMPPIRHAFATLAIGATYSVVCYFVFVYGYIIDYFHVSFAGTVSYATVTISQYLKVSNLFGRYITPEVRRYLMSNRDALELGGQETELSILFSDLKGFTSMSEKLEAREVISALNEYFGPMFKIIIDEERGTLDKLIGDAIMAYFGHPQPNKDHPVQAVRAALKMQRRLEELRQEWEKQGKPLVRMRIGVNTGRVVAGNMGDAGRTDYSIIGDNVNLASRLESNAPVDGVLISDSTYERVKDYFIFKEREPIMVKGKEKPIKVFEVLDMKEGVK